MSYLGYVALAMAALLLLSIVRTRTAHKRLQSESEASLARIYEAVPETPRLALSYSYGYPAFKVTFPSEQVLQAAADAGLNELFKRDIDAACRGHGPRSRPFNAEYGVFFTYEGALEAQMKEDSQSLDELRRDA